MIKINILYKDKHIVVCVKPSGVLSENGGMPELLSSELGGEFYCVHRLDQAVSGVMVYARNKNAASRLTSMLSSHEVVKEYLTIIQGKPENNNGILKDYLYKDSAKNKVYVVKKMRKGVKEAELEYSVMQQSEDCSLLKVRLYTGRSHQIRVQFASRQHPLLGDVKYGSKYKDCEIALFSHRLAFKHPITSQPLDFSACPENKYPWILFN